MFAWLTQTKGESTAMGFKAVVYMYAFLCIVLGVVLAMAFRQATPGAAHAACVARVVPWRSLIVARACACTCVCVCMCVCGTYTMV